MIRATMALAAALLMAAPAAAQEGVRQTAGGIMIDFPNTDMRLVVAALAEAAGLNVTYADLPSRTVSLRTSNPVPPEQVRVYLESLLRANQMELREKQAQQMALSRQRLLTLAFDDMETIRMVSAHAPRSVPKAHILVLP